MGTPVRHDELQPDLQPGSHPELTSAGALGHDPQRHLPVIDELARVLPEAGLVRGRTVVCSGGASVSLALTVVAQATSAGSWLAVVGVPWVGLEAARELGVALERTVLVEVPPRDPAAWAERVAAAADGFELVVTRVPVGVPDRLLRQVRQRLRTRGGVLVDLSASRQTVMSRQPAAGADLQLDADVGSWEGIEHGHGHLRCRRVTLTVSGRRTPRPVRVDCWLPGPSGRFELTDRQRSVPRSVREHAVDVGDQVGADRPILGVVAH